MRGEPDLWGPAPDEDAASLIDEDLEDEEDEDLEDEEDEEEIEEIEDEALVDEGQPEGK